MHDPMTVAFEIRRPFPQIRKTNGKKPFKIGASAFWHVGNYELYWPGLITVWHVDPSGYDSGFDCPWSSHWRLHVHHWKLQVHPLQHLRRRLLTRCEWCHGPSRKGDLVNHSHSWDIEKQPWWKGERGLYHSDCSSIHSAHQTCTCTLDSGGPWEHRTASKPYGRCATCLRFRAWRTPGDTTPWDEANRILQTIPTGQRDPDKTAAVRKLWADSRASLPTPTN